MRPTCAERMCDILCVALRLIRSPRVPLQCHAQQQAIQDRQMELSCFKALQRDEDQARPQRIAAMQTCVSIQVEREARLQERYAELARRNFTTLEHGGG